MCWSRLSGRKWWIVEPHMFVCESRNVFWQLAGSLCGLIPARQRRGSARSRECCGSWLHLCTCILPMMVFSETFVLFYTSGGSRWPGCQGPQRALCKSQGRWHQVLGLRKIGTSELCQATKVGFPLLVQGFWFPLEEAEDCGMSWDIGHLAPGFKTRQKHHRNILLENNP